MNKNQELEALYDTVAQLFFKNIQFLTKNFPPLLNKLNAFERLKSEHYFLEFINNHFELIDAQGKHYYNCNPFFDAQHRCENIEQKPCFNLLKQVEIRTGVLYKNSINAFEYINEYIALPNNQNKISFEKFIFLGTLLGVHLNDLDKALHSKVYLILEKNIEIFRLSLFLTDYEAINANATLFFCINEDEKRTQEIVQQFLHHKPQFNHQIGFEVADENSLPLIDTVTKICVDYDPYNYPFSEYLISLKRSFYYKKHSNYGILNCKKSHDILNAPVLFLGAGPSLASSIEWVYLYQDAFIVVCAAACLRRLELLDIVPDVIISVDGQYKQVIRQFEVNEKYYKNSLVVASTKTDLDVAQKFNALNTFYMPDNLEVFEKSGFFTGVTVGDVGLDFLLRFGAKEVYMLGFDACISKTGKTHDTIYKNNTVQIKESNVLQNSGLKTKTDLIKVKGNFEDEVHTFMQYTQMIDSIAQITAQKSSEVTIYNLSNGAYFYHTTPLKKESVVWDKFIPLNKVILQETVKTQLIEQSSKALTQRDMNDIKQEQKIIKKLQMATAIKVESEFIKLKRAHKNSLTLQILEKFFNLVKPYSMFKNEENAKELEFLHFQEVLTELKKAYQE
jgi:hypothetical protein